MKTKHTITSFKRLIAWILTLALVIGFLPKMALAWNTSLDGSNLDFYFSGAESGYNINIKLGDTVTVDITARQGSSKDQDEAAFYELLKQSITLAISSSRASTTAEDSSHIGKSTCQFTYSDKFESGYRISDPCTCQITIDPGKYTMDTKTEPYYLHLYAPLDKYNDHNYVIYSPQFKLIPPSLTLTPEQTYIHVGGTSQLTATLGDVAEGVTDKMTYTYSSSDDSIATVDKDGLVTAVAEGTANITAKAWYNNESGLQNQIAEATTTVTVHQRSWSTNWSSDSTHHWHDCTVSGCTVTDNSQKDGYEAHRYTDATDATCEVCGYERALYALSANAATLDFGSATEGYTAPAAQTVTITNTGNQTVTLNNPTSTGSAFVIGDLSTASLEPNGTATFTVQPQAGLAAGNYDETITITGSNGATAQVQATFSVAAQPEPPYFPPILPSEPEPDGPATEGSAGWSDIQSELEAAGDGDAITIEMNGASEVPAEIFETIAGQDITLSIELDNGVSWQINGTDIPAGTSLHDLDLGVTMNTSGISATIINNITGGVDTIQMTLSHDGEFGFAMTLSAPLGETHHGYWANLYYFDEATQRLIYQTASPICA